MPGNKCEARVVTTGRDIVNYIVNNGLEDALVCIGVEGYIDDTEVVAEYNGEMLLLSDNCYYDGYCD